MNQKEIAKYMEDLENEFKAKAYDYNLNHFGKQTLNYRELWYYVKNKLGAEKDSKEKK
jgi:hypothetical protein